MIRFLTTRGHEYTFTELIKGRIGPGTPRCAVTSYDRFLRRKSVPAGIYIFCDIERLTPFELRLAGEAFRILGRASGCRVLNDPARVMARYELLHNLRAQGINDFDAMRADEWRCPSRYPVFLRHEQDHGQLLSDLIDSPQALDKALGELRTDGTPSRGVLIVEYAAEPFAGSFFRKFNTFRVGSEVFAHHIVTQDSWVVKYGNPCAIKPEGTEQYERAFVAGNWHADLMRRVFDIAGIEYGRADFGIVGGRVQVYEINTNPFLSGAPASASQVRRRTIELSSRKLLDSLAALDNGAPGGAVKLTGPLLNSRRAGLKWYERPERRP
jgi:hypothetical protein